MWIIRKPSLREVVPSENAEPQGNSSTRNAQPAPASLSAQVDKIANSISQYTPTSDLVDMSALLTSPRHTLKKFRESVFLGEIFEGRRSGIGIMVYVNGRVYEGEWAENFKQGKGYEKFSNSSVYKGDYVKGKPDGCGRYQWENGEVY